MLILAAERLQKEQQTAASERAPNMLLKMFASSLGMLWVSLLNKRKEKAVNVLMPFQNVYILLYSFTYVPL